MYLVPSTQNVLIGQEFTVDVKIDTTDSSSSINAAQATIQFPVSMLSAVSVDTQSSTFDFWLTGPTITNDDGTIQFIGGTIKGIAGSALEIAQITFRATGVGSADLMIANGAVLAADGKGTNVLAGIQGVSIAVGTTAIPLLPNTGITRPAIAATILPVAPTISVPLYPDQSRWYNQVGETTALWNVPPDVTHVSASMSHSESNAIGTPETVLSDGKDFGILQDGIWYITSRFENNIGWGPPAYYKISVDTTPPLPFDTHIANAGTDNPSPSIQFETNDSLSGIADYTISIDGKEIAETTSTMMTLAPQPPGMHTLVVSASDLAGNSVQDSTTFTILPLPTPQVTFVEPSVIQGQFAFISGNATPSSSVDVVALDGDNREVFEGSAPVDSDGHWDITVNVPLAVGRYSISATERDNRGAESLATAPQAFTVRAPSVISFGFVELDWFAILLIVILLVATGVSLWAWRSTAKKQKRGLYNTMAGRDIDKLSDLLSVNIQDLAKLPFVKNATRDPELVYLIQKMGENVAKIQHYIKQELEKLT
jgi:hypothetical protein